MTTVLITGGSSGIGRATVELLLAKGWQVAVTSRDIATLSHWSSDPKVAVLHADLTQMESMRAAVEATVERFGKIDVLVNNAGYGVFGSLEGVADEEIERCFRTNLLAPIRMTQLVLPHMRANGGGTIINVSSIAGRTASPFASLYHASKFAIEGFSESIRYEASLHNVRIKLIEPSHFRTGFISGVIKSRHPAYDAPFDNYMKWVALEDAKAPTPEPVAEAIARASVDRSTRLRYPVKGAFIMALVRLLPDRLWTNLMAEGMTRVPKDRSPRTAPN